VAEDDGRRRPNRYLTWYLHELRGAGIRVTPYGTLACGFRWPVAAVRGLAEAGAERWLPKDLAALAVHGMAGLAVVGLLVFRMRAALIRARGRPTVRRPPHGSLEMSRPSQAAAPVCSAPRRTASRALFPRTPDDH